MKMLSRRAWTRFVAPKPALLSFVLLLASAAACDSADETLNLETYEKTTVVGHGDGESHKMRERLIVPSAGADGLVIRHNERGNLHELAPGDVYLASQSGKAQRLTHRGDVVVADRAEDGRLLLSTSEHRVILFDLRDGSARTLAERAGWARFSPSGQRVVLVRVSGDLEPGAFNAERALGIVMLSLEDGAVLRLTEHAEDFAPFFVTDDVVVFGSSRDEVAALWVMDVGGRARPLTNAGLTGVDDPTFVPLPHQYPTIDVADANGVALVRYPSDEGLIALRCELTSSGRLHRVDRVDLHLPSDPHQGVLQ